MSEINNNILDAMDLLVKKNLDALEVNTTIEAIIYNVDDSSIGKYKVKYQNTVLEAYTDNLETTYRVGETVYVQITNGDFGQKKFITGRKLLNTEHYVEIVDINQTIDEVGIPLDQIYGYSTDEIGIPGYYTDERERYYTIFDSTNTSGNVSFMDNVFQQYAKDRQFIKIQAKFRTKFDIFREIKLGNYGLRVVFGSNVLTAENNRQEREYIIDTKLMSGNVYTNNEYVMQTIVLNIDPNVLTGLKTIQLFSYNFEHYADDELTIIRPNEDLIEDEIFVKDLRIQFVEKIQAEAGYSANILTPHGIYLNLAPSYGIQLVPQLKFNGMEVTAKYKVEWFQIDNVILPGNKYYKPTGGRGWRFVSDDRELFVTSALLGQVGRFKMVITYQNKIIRDKEITLYDNLNSEGLYFIHYYKDVNGIVTLQVNKKGVAQDDPLSEIDVFSWSYKTMNGLEYIVSDSRVIHFDIASVDKAHEYTCCLYSRTALGDKLVAVLKYTVSAVVIESDLVVDFITDQSGLFNYDENGYIKLEEYLSQRHLDFAITWRTEEKPYKYEWLLPGYKTEDYIIRNGLLKVEGYGPSGVKKTTYEPDNSMLVFDHNTKLKGYHYDEVRFLDYRVNSQFDREKSNNEVILKLTIERKDYYFPFRFSFIKEGDIGTNGTDYQMLIRHDPSQMEHNLILNRNKVWQNSLRYKITIYHNGVPDDISNYNITCTIPELYQSNTILCNKVQQNLVNSKNPIQQEIDEIYKYMERDDVTAGQMKAYEMRIEDLKVMLNSQTSQYNFKYTLVGDTLTIYGNNTMTDPETFFSNIVEIKASPKSITLANYPIYYLLPIGTSIENKLSIDNMPIVMYDADGYNPSYSTAPLELYYPPDVTKRDELISHKAANSSTYSLVQNGSVDSLTGIFSAQPMYESQYAKNAIITTVLSSGKKIITPIVFMMNTYSMQGINSWNGIDVQIDEDEGTIYAPQIGAGMKDKNNKFTGAIMGLYNPRDGDSEAGLWGFQNGVQSFGFLADGTAFMGRADKGGQIKFDGNQGIIQSANYSGFDLAAELIYGNGTAENPSAKTMDSLPNNRSISRNRTYDAVINYRDNYIDPTSSSTVSGTMRLVVKGQLLEHPFTGSTKGRNIGLRLDLGLQYRLVGSSKYSVRVFIYVFKDEIEIYETRLSDNTTTKVDSSFYSDWTMYIVARKELGDGMQINLSDGLINAARFKLVSNLVTIDSTGGDILIKAGDNFMVTKSGGNIAGWKISADKLSSKTGETVLHSDGTITCKKLIANTEGEIGGWIIGKHTLESKDGRTVLDSKDSSITCKKLIAKTEGNIAGWIISSKGLYADNGDDPPDIYLYPDGNMSMTGTIYLGDKEHRTTLSSSGVSIWNGQIIIDAMSIKIKYKEEAGKKTGVQITSDYMTFSDVIKISSTAHQLFDSTYGVSIDKGGITFNYDSSDNNSTAVYFKSNGGVILGGMWLRESNAQATRGQLALEISCTGGPLAINGKHHVSIMGGSGNASLILANENPGDWDNLNLDFNPPATYAVRLGTTNFYAKLAKLYEAEIYGGLYICTSGSRVSLSNFIQQKIDAALS